jgi:hypothetical protein
MPRPAGLFRQQVRWAREVTVQLLGRRGPLRAPGLAPQQRLLLASEMALPWVATPLLMLLAAPLVYILAGAAPLDSLKLWEVALLYCPAGLASTVLVGAGCAAQMRCPCVPPEQRGPWQACAAAGAGARRPGLTIAVRTALLQVRAVHRGTTARLAIWHRLQMGFWLAPAWAVGSLLGVAAALLRHCCWAPRVSLLVARSARGFCRQAVQLGSTCGSCSRLTHLPPCTACRAAPGAYTNRSSPRAAAAAFFATSATTATAAMAATRAAAAAAAAHHTALRSPEPCRTSGPTCCTTWPRQLLSASSLSSWQLGRTGSSSCCSTWALHACCCACACACGHRCRRCYRGWRRSRAGGWCCCGPLQLRRSPPRHWTRAAQVRPPACRPARTPRTPARPPACTHARPPARQPASPPARLTA